MKIEKVEVQEIARQFGTPVYVYSLEILRQSINEIKKLSPVTRYAMKASSNVKILQEMLANGVKIDAVSVYEVQRAIRAGFKAEDICFTSDVFFNGYYFFILNCDINILTTIRKIGVFNK